MHGPPQARPFHRRRRSGPSFWAPDAHYTCLVTGEESGGAYCAMHVTVPPGGGPPSHVHRREDATFYVLEGTPTFDLEDERVVAIPGDFVNVPKGTRHGFRNISLEPVRMILTFMPAGIERRLEQRLERAPDSSL
jgi:quercetin dioxygenase-like cupin family protein